MLTTWARPRKEEEAGRLGPGLGEAELADGWACAAEAGYACARTRAWKREAGWWRILAGWPAKLRRRRDGEEAGNG